MYAIHSNYQNLWTTLISHTSAADIRQNKKVSRCPTFSLEAPVCSRFCKDLLPEAQVLGPTQGIERWVNQTANTLPIDVGALMRSWSYWCPKHSLHWESRPFSLLSEDLVSRPPWTEIFVTWNSQCTIRGHSIRSTKLFHYQLSLNSKCLTKS